MYKLSLFLLALLLLFSCSDDFFPDEEGVVRVCGLSDLEVKLGDCNEDGSYDLELDFVAANADNSFYEIFLRGNERVDSFRLSSLPQKIDNFQPSGQSFDFIKVCITDNSSCCQEIEFMPPVCEEMDTSSVLDTMGMDSTGVMSNCVLSSLTIASGDCTSDSTYFLEINFQFEEPGSETYDVLLRNDELFGTYNLEELPLQLENFQPSGSDDDYVKVCITGNPACCKVIEFPSTSCLGSGAGMDMDTTDTGMGMDTGMDMDTTMVEEVCEIRELIVEVGDCSSDSTYSIEINFGHTNASNESFDVFIREDELLESYSLADLPVRFDQFTPSGLAEDFIKICIRDNPDCCQEIEFMPPSCINDNTTMEEVCEISNLMAEVGECTSDSTYVLEINFEIDNPGNESFDLFVRGDQLIDFFPITDLPIRLDSFAPSGLDFDFIKVCINDNPDCCQEIEFMPPDCIE